MKGDRWTQELELRLVKLYKKFRCLWMMSLSAYNDLDRRYAAYVRIVEALRPEFRSLTVPKVVYKIRDLRYRYCVELTKIERGAASGENYIPNVSWFKVMQSFLDLRFRTDENKDSHSTFSSEPKFCYDYSGTRLTSSTCQTIYDNHLKMEESKSTVGEFEESGNDVGNYVEVYDRRRRCREAEEYKEENIQLGDFLRNELSEIKIRNKMTKTLLSAERDSNFESEIENDEYFDGIEGDETRTNEFDEFDAFAMSIASQLKTLDSGLVAKLEMIILMIFNEERTKSLENNFSRKDFTTHGMEKGSPIIPSTLSPNDPTIRAVR